MKDFGRRSTNIDMIRKFIANKISECAKLFEIFRRNGKRSKEESGMVVDNISNKEKYIHKEMK